MSATLELYSNEDEFINCSQAATLLGVSKSTFSRIRLATGIPTYRHPSRPRFKVADILEYKEKCREMPDAKFASSSEMAKVSLRSKK